MSNYIRSTFYIGVTNDLLRRVMEHKGGKIPGFTQKYNLKYLVYFESIRSIEEAIHREKQIKNWHREWKLNLIRSINPELKDLTPELLGMDAETGSA